MRTRKNWNSAGGRHRDRMLACNTVKLGLHEQNLCLTVQDNGATLIQLMKSFMDEIKNIKDEKFQNTHIANDKVKTSVAQKFFSCKEVVQEMKKVCLVCVCAHRVLIVCPCACNPLMY